MIVQRAHNMFVRALQDAGCGTIAVLGLAGSKSKVVDSRGRAKWKIRKETLYEVCMCKPDYQCWLCQAFDARALQVINVWRREEGLPVLYKVHVINAPQ